MSAKTVGSEGGAAGQEVISTPERAAIDRELATFEQWLAQIKKEREDVPMMLNAMREAVVGINGESGWSEGPKKVAALEFLATHQSEMRTGAREGKRGKKEKPRVVTSDVARPKASAGKGSLADQAAALQARLAAGGEVLPTARPETAVPVEKAAAVAGPEPAPKVEENITSEKVHSEIVRKALFSFDLLPQVERIIVENFSSYLKPSEWAEPEKNQKAISSLVREVERRLDNRFDQLSKVMRGEKITGRETRRIVEDHYADIAGEDFADPEKLKAKAAPLLLEVRHKAQEALSQLRREIPEFFQFPVVREKGKKGDRVINLDSQACLFMLRDVIGMGRPDATDKERSFVDPNNIRFVKVDEVIPGGLHLNMSPGVHGSAMFEGAGFFDHHGKDSPRRSSAFGEMYKQFDEAGVLDALNQEQEAALFRLVKFVTSIDSYTLPGKEETGGRQVGWRDAWGQAEKTVFGLAMANQDDFPVEVLAEFFKTHNLQDAFTPGKLKELPGDFQPTAKVFSSNLERSAKRLDDLLKAAGEEKLKSGSSVDSKLGRILVYVQDDQKMKKPELQFAALGHGYAGVLVWKPKSRSFFLGVGPGVTIPEEVAQVFGESAVSVRKGMLLQKKEKGSTLSLKEVLSKLGVDVESVKKRLTDRKNTDGRVFAELSAAPVEISVSEPPEVTGGVIKGETPAEVTNPERRAEEPAFNERFWEGVLNTEKRIPWELVPASTDVLCRNWDKISALVERIAPTEIHSTLQMVATALYRKTDLTEAERNWLEARQKDSLKELLGAKVHIARKQLTPGEEAFWEHGGPNPYLPQEVAPVADESGDVVPDVISPPGADVVEAVPAVPGEAREVGESVREETPPVPVEIPAEVSAPTPLVETVTPSVVETPQLVAKESVMNDAKQNYLDKVREFQDTKSRGNLGARIKSETWKVWRWFKKPEGSDNAEELKRLKAEVEAARQEYNKARGEYAAEMCLAKEQELIKSGLTPDQVREEMEKYRHEAILLGLFANQENSLQQARVAEMPEKKRGLIRKLWDFYRKQNIVIRMALSAGVMTGLLFASGEASVAVLAGYFGTRIVRSLIIGGGVAAEGAAIEAGGKRIIKRGHEKRMSEMSSVEGFSPEVLTELSEKYQKVLEKKAKAEKTLLAIKIAAVVGTLGAVVGVSMLEHHQEAAAQAAAEAEKAEQAQAAAKQALGDYQKQLEEFASTAKAKGQTLVEAFKEKVAETGAGLKHAAETGRLQDLSTLHKGEGVIHVFSRQLEAFPEKFGFTGNVHNAGAVHAWAEHQAADIAIKQGYWDPATGEQNWVRWSPNAKMHFNLEGDSQHGFKVSEIGTEGKHFIHHATETDVAPQEASTAVDKLPADAHRILGRVDETVGRVSGGKAATLDSVFTRAPGVGAGTHATENLSKFPTEVRPYADYLQHKVVAAHDLATKYAHDPILGPRAAALEHSIQDQVSGFVDKVDAHNYKGFLKVPKGDIGADLERMLRDMGRGAAENVPVETNSVVYVGDVGIKFIQDGGALRPVFENNMADLGRQYAEGDWAKMGFFDHDFKVGEALRHDTSFYRLGMGKNLSEIDLYQKVLDKVPAGSAESAAIKHAIHAKMEATLRLVKEADPKKVFSAELLKKFW